MSAHPRHRTIVLPMLVVFICVALFMVLGFSPSRNDPFHSPYIDNQTHSIAANSDTWFHFDYGITNPPRTVVTLALVNGVSSGLQFQLWAPEVITEWWLNNPTGVGMVQNIDCSTGTLMGAGPCQSKDLIWYGAFGGAGTYYVRVINNNPFPAQFRLTVQGTSVSPAPAVASVAPGTRAIAPVPPTPSRTPVVAALPTPYDDPFHSAPLDGQVHTIPGSSATWFNFDYGTPGNFQYRPRVGLRLVGAAGTGVGFQVWSADRLDQWWQSPPVGRGTQEYSNDCQAQEIPTAVPTLTPNPTFTLTPTTTATPTSTVAPTNTPGPEPLCTHTPTNDLTWFGAFGGPGKIYVRVINTNASPMNFQLAQW